MRKTTQHHLGLSIILLGLVILLGFGCTPNNSAANDSDIFPESKIAFAPKHYICYQSEALLKIDGQMTEAAWQNAPWTSICVRLPSRNVSNGAIASGRKSC